MNQARQRKLGFSLVELVIVIVILGIVAAIAVPRISRGAKGAGDSALRADLAAFRNAIDLYAAEHRGEFPEVAKFSDQVMQYTNDDGDPSVTSDAAHPFGPYLRSLPPLPMGGTGANSGAKGSTKVAAAAAADVGWIYNDSTGKISANTGTLEDENSVLYSDY